MNSCEEYQSRSSSFWSTLTPRCPMCRSSHLRPARSARRTRWRSRVVCKSCGIRFQVNTLQLALSARYGQPKEERSITIEYAPMPEPPSLRLGLTHKVRAREQELKAVIDTPPATKIMSGDLPLLMRQLSSAVAHSIRERWQWLNVRTAPTKKRD